MKIIGQSKSFISKEGMSIKTWFFLQSKAKRWYFVTPYEIGSNMCVPVENYRSQTSQNAIFLETLGSREKSGVFWLFKFLWHRTTFNVKIHFLFKCWKVLFFEEVTLFSLFIDLQGQIALSTFQKKVVTFEKRQLSSKLLRRRLAVLLVRLGRD